jgi:osmotically-inducible protein OsmY
MHALKGKTVGQSVDDTKITSEVKAKLAADKAATLTRVSVSTNQGSVVLTGNVDKPEERARAEELARQVDGVREVANNIKFAKTGG